MAEWHILTGEYPPQQGGVSDYTRQVAHGLVERGDAVRVWAPGSSYREEDDGRVRVHRLSDHFGLRGLRELHREFRWGGGQRLLVQYVPHAFGLRGMNLPFCAWVSLWSQRVPVWVMFHEVAYPFRRDQPLRHRVLGAVTHLMAAVLARVAERVFVSTLSWRPMLNRVGCRPSKVHWLPVPSNLPGQVPAEAVAGLRRGLALAPGDKLIGHFGTYGTLIASALEEILLVLLGLHPRCRALLIGRGSEALLDRIVRRSPTRAQQLSATGQLPQGEVAAHLAACDLLLQPYPDGITTRCTSLMAALALGMPVVATQGHLTEPLWAQERLVVLAPADDTAAFVAAAEHLLDAPEARFLLGHRAREGYRRFFSLDQTLAILRDPSSTQAMQSCRPEGRSRS